VIIIGKSDSIFSEIPRKNNPRPPVEKGKERSSEHFKCRDGPTRRSEPLGTLERERHAGRPEYRREVRRRMAKKLIQLERRESGQKVYYLRGETYGKTLSG